MVAVSSDYARFMTVTQIDDRLRQLSLYQQAIRTDLWHREVDHLLDARTRATIK